MASPPNRSIIANLARALRAPITRPLAALAVAAVLACLINFVWVAGLRTAEESATDTQQRLEQSTRGIPIQIKTIRPKGTPITAPVSLKELPRGAQGWMVPWVVRFDSNGLAYLDDALVEPRSGGTLSLAVNRTADGALHARLYDLSQFESTVTDPSRLGEPVEMTVLPCQSYRTASDGLIADDCQSVAAASDYVTSQKVPAYARELTIGELPAGKAGWTVPWSLGQASDGSYVVARDYMIKRRGGGTLELRIERGADHKLRATCAPGTTPLVEMRADVSGSDYEPIDVLCPLVHNRPR